MFFLLKGLCGLVFPQDQNPTVLSFPKANAESALESDSSSDADSHPSSSGLCETLDGANPRLVEYCCGPPEESLRVAFLRSRLFWSRAIFASPAPMARISASVLPAEDFPEYLWLPWVLVLLSSL